VSPTPIERTEQDRFERSHSSVGVISRGIVWKLGSQITVQVFGLGVSLGVARLLLPSEYGLASLALSVAAFGAIFSEVSLGAVLVQKRTVGQTDASSLMWFSVGLGLVLTIALALLAPALASLMGTDGLRPLLLGVAPVFLISTVGTVPTALLNRRMEFRRLELRTIAATVTSSVCALLIALAGGGAWALVGQQIVQVTMLTALAWIGARWIPSFVFSRKDLGGLAAFGLYVVGSRAFSTLGANIDNLLVGRYAGEAALGAYAVAYNVLLIPLTRLAVPIQEVAFPAFSLLGDPEAVGRLWLRANRALFALVAPVMLALAVETNDFVAVVLGQRWAAAAPLLRLLAIGGLLQSLIRLTPSVLQACARQRLLFIFSAGTAGVLVVAFVVGLHWGAEGVAAGFATATAIVLPVGLTTVIQATRVKATAVARSLGPVVAASALMTVVMIALRASVPFGSVMALVIVPAVGVVAFAAYLLWRAHDVMADLRTLARSLRTEVDG
jgi:O-antigen/teichoic acid export membrane protein